MKIYIEVEDPVIGKKVKELVEALEKTRAPEQVYLIIIIIIYYLFGANIYMNIFKCALQVTLK